MAKINKNRGEIRISPNINVRAHELKTARALAESGYTVEFLPEKDIKNTKSPDILMNGNKWEIKSPKTDKLPAIERNLRRATKQSSNIIIDSHRLHKIHDSTIQKFLVQRYIHRKSIERLLFVNRKRQIIDISKVP